MRSKSEVRRLAHQDPQLCVEENELLRAALTKQGGLPPALYDQMLTVLELAEGNWMFGGPGKEDISFNGDKEALQQIKDWFKEVRK